MNRNNLLVQYDKDLRLHIRYPEARKEITKDVVRILRNAPGMNVVAFTFANEARLDSVIAREVDYLQPLNQPFTWKVYDHDLLPSLKGKLASRGFQEDADPADVMVLDVKKAPAELLQPVTTDIRRVTDLDWIEGCHPCPGPGLGRAQHLGQRTARQASPNPGVFERVRGLYGKPARFDRLDLFPARPFRHSLCRLDLAGFSQEGALHQSAGDKSPGDP